MRRLRIIFGLSLALGLAGCATQPAMPLATITTAAAAASPEDELRGLLADEQRVNDVFGRLVTSNIALCEDEFVPSFGFRLWSLSDFSPENQPAAAAAFGLDERLHVYAVMANHPAAAAGVKPGDVLTRIEGKPIDAGEASRSVFGAKVTEGLMKRGRVRFDFDRAGKPYRATLHALKSCPVSVALAVGDEPNAATDGRTVFVTTGMLKFAPDDRDLAIVLGHEIAHAIRKHAQKLQEAEQRSTIRKVAGRIVEAAAGLAGAVPNPIAYELEADALGLYIAANAGYDISKAPQIWRRLQEEFPSTSSGGWTHPSSEARFRAMSDTVEEIAEKRAAGRPLMPDEPTS